MRTKIRPTPEDLVELYSRGCKPYAKNIKLVKKGVAGLLIFGSLIIPDLGVGFLVGTTFLSGIPLRIKAKSIKNEIKTKWRIRRILR